MLNFAMVSMVPDPPTKSATKNTITMKMKHAKATGLLLGNSVFASNAVRLPLVVRDRKEIKLKWQRRSGPIWSARRIIAHLMMIQFYWEPKMVV